MMSEGIFVLLCCVVTAVCGYGKDTLVVFGAGYEDNGVNMPDDNVGLHKYSTGNNWPDYVAEKLKMKLQNYAVAGALTGIDNYYFKGWSGNQWQVDEYMKNNGRTVKSNVLVGFMTGGINEMFYGNYTEAFLNGIVTNTVNQIRQLLRAGATVVFVLNIPDYTMAPGAKKDNTAEANLNARNGIINHNKKMAIALNNLPQSNEFRNNRNIKIVQIDFHTLWSNSINSKEFKDTFGFHCINRDEIEYPADIYYQSTTTTNKDMMKYAFYDAYHPATAVHYDVANNIVAQLGAVGITACGKK